MVKADGLSRRPDWKVGIEKNNENQIVVKENWLHSRQKVVIEGPEVEKIKKIKKARNKNKDIVRIVEEIKKTNIKELRGDK